MTLRLILTRHAKSGWDDPLLDDHSRYLTSRGVRAAGAIGQWLVEKGHRPDLILCSDAKRTRQTCSLIATEFPSPIETRFEAALYLASPDVMLKQLQQAGDSQVVMMIAHNPGTALTAGGLASAPPMHPDFDRYPTCATTVLEFPTQSWSSVTWGHGKVLDFVVPRDLTKSDRSE